MEDIKQNPLFLLCYPVYVRVLEYTSDLAVFYSCTYVEGDGKCQTGRSNYYIVSRNRNYEIPAGVLAVYAYQATGLCIEDFSADFVKVPSTAGNYDVLSFWLFVVSPLLLFCHFASFAWKFPH